MTNNNTHSKTLGYLLWIFGITGAHRLYYGKPVTGTIWFFTLGLAGIGPWLFAHDDRPDAWDDFTFYWKSGTLPDDPANRYADLLRDAAGLG